MTNGDKDTVHIRSFAELTSGELLALLRLRVDVFVVEQECAYAEIDGRDDEVGTRHLWTSDDFGPSAYMRLLKDDDAVRIGRVCTRADRRGSGLAALLMEHALELNPREVHVLAAQSQLAGWYGRFGFEPDGEPFIEDGIPHIPMRRAV